jgi:predicted secreted protein
VKHDDFDRGSGLAAFHLTQTLLWLLVRHRVLHRVAALDALSILPSSMRERYADGSVEPATVQSAITHLETLRKLLESTTSDPPPAGTDDKSS